MYTEDNETYEENGIKTRSVTEIVFSFTVGESAIKITVARENDYENGQDSERVYEHVTPASFKRAHEVAYKYHGETYTNMTMTTIDHCYGYMFIGRAVYNGS